jgi:hypothetical protein
MMTTARVLLCWFGFAHLASAAGAAIKTTPGEFVIDPPTLINLGFEWLIEGDDNRNATVEVAERLVRAGTRTRSPPRGLWLDVGLVCPAHWGRQDHRYLLAVLRVGFAVELEQIPLLQDDAYKDVAGRGERE